MILIFDVYTPDDTLTAFVDCGGWDPDEASAFVSWADDNYAEIGRADAIVFIPGHEAKSLEDAVKTPWSRHTKDMSPLSARAVKTLARIATRDEMRAAAQAEVERRAAL